MRCIRTSSGDGGWSTLNFYNFYRHYFQQGERFWNALQPFRFHCTLTPLLPKCNAKPTAVYCFFFLPESAFMAVTYCRRAKLKWLPILWLSSVVHYSWMVNSPQIAWFSSKPSQNTAFENKSLIPIIYHLMLGINSSERPSGLHFTGRSGPWGHTG